MRPTLPPRPGRGKQAAPVRTVPAAVRTAPAPARTWARAGGAIRTPEGHVTPSVK
ncbi:hypothetical protein [Streptomyces sp. NPDC054784]